MACIVLDYEVADKNVIKEIGVFLQQSPGMLISSFKKKNKPTKQTFWCTRNLHGIVWNSGGLDYSELSNIVPRAVKREKFAQRTEKCKILGNLLDKEVKELEDHGCTKIQDPVDEEISICSS